MSPKLFSCPMCWNLLKDPVTTPCGRSFCNMCINSHWDQEDEMGMYSCPQCRETFYPRPVLRRNNMLAEVVEKLKKSGVQPASSARCSAGPGDVECDSCTGRKLKAVKSCLVCQASYCEDHLQPHFQSPALKEHKLVEACAELQEKICPEHDKLIDIYCRTDQSFICYLCMMEEHKDHDTVAFKAKRSEKQNELNVEHMKKQKKLQELKHAVDSIKKHSQAAVSYSERIFTEMIISMEKKRSEVTELIRTQEKAELSRAERLLEQLEQEIADLNMRFTEVEQVSHTHDHIQSFQPLCVSSEYDDSSSFNINQQPSFDGVKKSLLNLRKYVEEKCMEEFNRIRPQAAAVKLMLLSDPKSREDFLYYFRYMTLDPNTANHYLVLSEKNRAVTHSDTDQRYPNHPERFDFISQVLCKESVCGRCYWEVEWSGEYVSLSVAYKEITRKGQNADCVFECTSQSWSLQCSTSSVSLWHKDRSINFQGPVSSRIGVYVDHGAGTLSFYSVSDTMTLIHRVHTTFTQPLYAGFSIRSNNSAVRLCYS